LIIECDSCHARYQYDEQRFERKPSKKIKCAKCGTVFEIINPAFAPKMDPPVGDQTFAKAPKSELDRVTEKKEEPPPTARVPTEPQLPVGKRLSLAIINGADAGAVYRIEKPKITIGRAGNDVNINDTEASRNHAAIEIRDTMYLLSDLKSTNGTLVDGEKITAQVEMQNHSEFQIGSTTIMLIVTEDV
jgi:predicted Zn finger-like uncharacterized protein